MRIFAFYLPQFHEIEENNKWWGKGFTEWVSVKKATPLFKKHIQPKEPLNDNYYCLLDKSTVQWQTNLMHEYGVDGMIYYHYYFCGKKLLEKPAENLLKWKDINQPFFFCWANHSWIRSWNGTKEMLLEQTYGTEVDWEKHFQYLLPFFKDERYEKKDNKPLFMLFRKKMKEKKEVFAYFDQRCKEEGFDGIYLIETCYADNDIEKFREEACPQTEKFYYREPDMSKFCFHKKIHANKYYFRNRIIGLFTRFGISLGTKIYMCKDLINVQLTEENEAEDIIHGLFFEWDNTPRHKERGYIIFPAEKKEYDRLFERYKTDDYLFVNAWNEWAEGMVLEPTKDNGYRYLEWIKTWSEN